MFPTLDQSHTQKVAECTLYGKLEVDELGPNLR